MRLTSNGTCFRQDTEDEFNGHPTASASREKGFPGSSYCAAKGALLLQDVQYFNNRHMFGLVTYKGPVGESAIAALKSDLLDGKRRWASTLPPPADCGASIGHDSLMCE